MKITNFLFAVSLLFIASYSFAACQFSCDASTPYFRGVTKAAAFQACLLGRGLVESGTSLTDALRACRESYPFDDLRLRKLLDLGVFSKEEIAFLPIY